MKLSKKKGGERMIKLKTDSGKDVWLRTSAVVAVYPIDKQTCRVSMINGDRYEIEGSVAKVIKLIREAD